MEDINNLLDRTSLDERQQHPRFNDFKNEGRVAERQRLRREEHLKKQNWYRQEALDKLRNLNNHVEKQNAFRNKKNSCSPFANQLMLSDWLVDIPGTLSTEWTMIPSPVGRRCLVVANNSYTTLFNKRGHQIARFESGLPGGSMDCKRKTNVTIIDCIFDREKKKLYALDLIGWNNNYFVDSNFSCRKYLLDSKLTEDLCLLPSDKPLYEFVSLPYCACSIETMTEFMKEGFRFELDGLLFYHSKAQYIPEQTPLVGWLKPWMLPEILNVPVPDTYLKGIEYSSSREFIKQFNDAHGHKSSKEIKQEAKRSNEDIPSDCQ